MKQWEEYYEMWLKRKRDNMDVTERELAGQARTVTEVELAQALVRLGHGHDISAIKMVNDIIEHRDAKKNVSTERITRDELSAALTRMTVRDSYGYLKFKENWGNADSLSRDIFDNVNKHHENLVELAYYKASDGVLWCLVGGRFIRFGDAQRYDKSFPKRPLKKLHDDI